MQRLVRSQLQKPPMQKEMNILHERMWGQVLNYKVLIATPLPVLWMINNVRPYGIQGYIPAEFKEVAVYPYRV